MDPDPPLRPGADLDLEELRGLDLRNASVAQGRVVECTLEDCDLDGLDLSGTRVVDTVLRSCRAGTITGPDGVWQHVVLDERQQHPSRPRRLGAELERGAEPGLAQQLHQVRRQRRRAVVAAREAGQRLPELAPDRPLVHLVVAQEAMEVGVRGAAGLLRLAGPSPFSSLAAPGFPGPGRA